MQKQHMCAAFHRGVSCFGWKSIITANSAGYRRPRRLLSFPYLLYITAEVLRANIDYKLVFLL